MPAVSSESLRTVQSELSSTVEKADLTVADEVFTALDVFDSSAGLRRALTDPSREPRERAGVLRSLFGHKVRDDTMTILTTVVSQRWSKERDLGDALEVLAVDMVCADVEHEGLGGLEKLEASLLSYHHVVLSSHELQRALTDAQAPVEAKSRLAERITPEVSSAARLLIKRTALAPRGLRPATLAKNFADQVAARQQRWIARVTVAQRLDDDYTRKLGRQLDNYFGRSLRLDIITDPEVIGGIRVQVGDEVVDDTVATRLHRLKRSMK